MGDSSSGNLDLSNFSKAMLALSLSLFGVSLVFPIASPSQGAPEGFGALAFGFFAFVFGGIEPLWSAASWFANGTFGAALVAGRNPRIRRFLALLTLVLGLLFLGVDKIRVSDSGPLAPVRPGMAFYLWFGSILVLNVWAWSPRLSNANASVELDPHP